MNSNSILTSDVLDILFENRNKNYGAYNLRKFYPNRVKTSLFIMLGLAIVFSAFTFLPEKKVDGDYFITEEGPTLGSVEPPKKAEPPKPKTATAFTVPSQKLTSVIKMVNEKDSADIFHDITNLQIGSRTNINIDAPPAEGDGGPLVGSGGNAEPAKPAEPEVDNNTVVDHPDVQASFPGGETALINFLQKNLRSPQDLNEGETIQVRVKYVVGFDGNLQGFDVIQDGGSVFNNEVIRVLKKMPKWNPGKKGGRNVPVYYSLPVKFTSAE
jgi:periplasmic protein TonB